ncbi:uncharacterized protein Eint_041300 [Encephalitozoon intestinalis ATCC 50506]|uniref:Uncharacterized protein n=1 Tax=Encephalitozoon intestinalis (strain ATCC 50506) TaxID=876142 RepID=E0S6T4_ENCIT|nr:uncharacterized protein Eint_041300 [Encephalitozoon intestinalis ATCC 50506]ADM11419.1 hypothetical protein Eint_041300 [Encephalitozoon intestinalis ATCC 50506]UTX45111.1 hypothetical protein GPK93_04g06490 [Encephalitozoon intestinalis]
MNLISASDRDIIVRMDETLIVRDVFSGTTRKMTAPPLISFMSGKYLVDKEKNLHVVDGPVLRNASKLNRNIFCLVEHEGTAYVADRFGDVYRIENEGCKYVLGTLSYLTGMAIYNGRILLSDKYGRIRISEMNGRILDYRFGCDSIESLECVNGLLISISNKNMVLYDEECFPRCTFKLPEGIRVMKTITKGKNELVVICLNSYFLFKIEKNSIGLVSHVKESIVDGACIGDLFYKVLPDLTVVDCQGRIFYE